MEQTPVVTIDPIKESLNHLLALTFPKTRSSLYPLAIAVAQGAIIYREIQIDKQIVHIVVFGKTPEDAGRAQVLLQYLRNWRGVQMFAKGQLITNPYRVSEVLRCYLKALTVNDRTAHCHVVISDPTRSEYGGGFSIHISLDEISRPSPPVDKYIFPCKFIVNEFSYIQRHPASIYDQIHARAVESGCHICPYFNERDFKSA